MKKSPKEIKYKFKYFQRMILRYWAVILLSCAIAGTGGGLIARVIYSPEYTISQAFTIELNDHPEANTATIGNNQLSKTVPSLMTSDVFVDFIKRQLGNNIKGTFDIEALSYSNIFTIYVTSDSNDNCNKILKAIENNYNTLSKGIIGESTMRLIASPVQSNTPANAPKYVLFIIMGIGIVLLFTTVICALRTAVTPTITDAAQAEQELKSICLAEIKQTAVKKHSNKEKNLLIPLASDPNADTKFAQQISTFSTKTDEICKSKGMKVILITSTVSGEGKSSMAINLADDLADKGKKVLLIDCDFRSPSVHKYLKKPILNGTVDDVIYGKKGIAQCTTAILDGFDILVNTDSNPYNSTKKTEGSFQKLIDSARILYDYIILDTPPSGFLGDSTEISNHADATIYITTHNSISLNYVKNTISTFNNSRTPLIGFVINHH